MATRTSLDTKVPPPTPSSPRSPQLPQIGSLAVTDVIGGGDLQGSQRSSADAMQAFQRQQALPAAAVLSPSRVNTSVADDMDDLLNETLEEFKSSPAAASSSSVLPAAAPSFAPAQIDLDFHEMEELLVSIIGFQFAELLLPPESGDALNDDTFRVGQSLNTSIGSINLFFRSLLAEAANPGAWLERESKTPFFCNTHPFGASCFLMAHLDRAADIRSYVKKSLLAEWKDNYQQCVLLLKRSGLDRYNETEFPFSAQNKPMISMVQMVGEQLKNPMVADMMRQQMSSFAQDPEGMLNKLQAQNPQLAETMKAQMGALGSDPASLEAMIKPQVQPLVSFFQELDQVLKRHPTDAGAVETWLKAEAAKSTYPHPFFCRTDLSNRLAMSGVLPSQTPPILLEMTQLSKSCCERLRALGLQRYVDEAPPKHSMDLLRQTAIRHKENFQDMLSKSLSVLRPLSTELKKLTLAPEARDANRRAIESWITSCKAAGTYFPPFAAGQDLCQYLPAFDGILDGGQLRELNVLLPFCREQLLDLGLKTYVEEIPSLAQISTTAAPAAAAAVAPKKALSDKERFKMELAFFREMIKIDDKAVDQWLKDNSPKLDYPLLWAKKRMSQLSQFRDTVDMDLRRDWRMCAETCLERVPNSAHVDIRQIPADASPELRTFLA